MNAKEFLLTDPKIEEAVSNGYDIRLEEHEWIEKMELYALTKQNSHKHGVSGKRAHCNCISGSLLLHDLLQVANIKNEDGMSVVEYVNKPNGGSVAYIRHDAMVKKLNSIMAACASGAVDKTVRVDLSKMQDLDKDIKDKLDNGGLWDTNENKMDEQAEQVKTTELNFGQAIERLKSGERVQRAGWNGKNMHIFLEEHFTALINMGGRKVERKYEPVICMWTAQQTTQPGWLASQADILANDWQIVRN